jgi:hypothetical protein
MIQQIMLGLGQKIVVLWSWTRYWPILCVSFQQTTGSADTDSAQSGTFLGYSMM